MSDLLCLQCYIRFLVYTQLVFLAERAVTVLVSPQSENWVGAGWTVGHRIRAVVGILILATTSKPGVGHRKNRTQCVLGIFFRVIKRPMCEADDSPAFYAETFITSRFLYASMKWCLGTGPHLALATPLRLLEHQVLLLCNFWSEFSNKIQVEGTQEFPECL